MPLTWKYDQRIASDPDLCAPIIAQLLDQLTLHTWSNKDAFGIHMAMEEAILNAIRHGNKCRPGTFVHVTMELDDVQFEGTITDEGTGFDPDCIPDPTEDQNLDKCSGRGVMLIKHFVDEVNYNACGNSVSLSKTKTS